MTGTPDSIGGAFVLLPVIQGPGAQHDPGRPTETRLAEAADLARAIGLEVLACEIARVSRPKAGSLLGDGIISIWAKRIEDEKPDVVIVDGALTPVQQRTLEQRWKTKVIDRTGLILEIFGERARTAEGRLQVELAHLSYQRSRLVRSWTHLERQRGGAGFMGGPGERQIELDRRLLDQRIDSLKQELQSVRRTRGLHRSARERVPFPIIALVGYTNAGKSTLFNRLTDSTVLAKSMVFATLDPTMRRIVLPGGKEAILSDTVGFITDLPTSLVAAFRATLEEVQGADLILHVRDISAADSDAQRADVATVLSELEIDIDHDERVIEVWNKIDLLPEGDERGEASPVNGSRRPVATSALTGQGFDTLMALVEAQLYRDWQELVVTVDHSDGRSISWIYDHCDVQNRADDETGTTFTVRAAPSEVGRLRRMPVKVVTPATFSAGTSHLGLGGQA
ncbi:MAG: GTPase HflX [Pseudomonadota bacterium]